MFGLGTRESATVALVSMADSGRQRVYTIGILGYALASAVVLLVADLPIPIGLAALGILFFPYLSLVSAIATRKVGSDEWVPTDAGAMQSESEQEAEPEPDVEPATEAEQRSVANASETRLSASNTYDKRKKG
jgi:hypothetical protein